MDKIDAHKECVRDHNVIEIHVVRVFIWSSHSHSVKHKKNDKIIDDNSELYCHQTACCSCTCKAPSFYWLASHCQ